MMKKLMIALTSICGAWSFSHGASWEGMGTESSPYMISTSSQLVELANEVNGGEEYTNEYFSLANDIDLSEVCGESIGNWTAIGSLSYHFNGTFWGNNHVVSNLYVNQENNENYCGLFGVVGREGAVYDLILDKGYAYSDFWAAGVCGLNNGLISNCKNLGCSVSSWRFSGGVCGSNFNTIINCHNKAEVSANTMGGGICAYNYGSIISCTNDNGIVANYGCGGICGYNGGLGYTDNCNDVKIGFIDDCKNYASIMGKEKIGGIVGRNDGFVTNSMNGGDLIGDQQVGGLVGLNGGFDGMVGNISNSFNVGEVTARDTLVGGIVGYGNQYSEIYNVFTSDDVHCISSAFTGYIGEEDGVKESDFVVEQENDMIELSYVKSHLNEWVDSSSNSDSYFGWQIKGSMIVFATQDSLPMTSTLNRLNDNIGFFSGKNRFYALSPVDRTVDVYSVEGKYVRTVRLTSNVMEMVPVEKGIYFVEDRKVLAY